MILTGDAATDFRRLIHRLSPRCLLWERKPFYSCSSMAVNCEPLDAQKSHMLHKRCAYYNKALKRSPGFNHNGSTGCNGVCSLFSNLLESLSVVCGIRPNQSNLYGDSDNLSEEGTLFITGGISSVTFRSCKQCWIDAL